MADGPENGGEKPPHQNRHIFRYGIHVDGELVVMLNEGFRYDHLHPNGVSML